MQSYERRGKEIKSAKEAKQWQLITPEMMSDEELVGDEYIRHPPSYRSVKLNRFLNKLDLRAERNNTRTAHPRVPRQLGSPVTKRAPHHAKKWMISKEPESQSHDFGEGSEELFADNSDDWSSDLSCSTEG